MDSNSGWKTEHARITANSIDLVHDARSLLGLAVEAVAKSNAHMSRSTALIDQKYQHLAGRDALIRESRIARAQLRAAVVALTRQLRSMGEPPEKILKRLRKLVVEAEAERLQADVAQSFMDDVLHWSVAAYYAA